jgi:ribokinase
VVSEVVDTTGAGDAFVGALASFLAKGESLGRAVEVGVLAGSFAVTSPGAQSSYPTLVDLQLDTIPLTN